MHRTSTAIFVGLLTVLGAARAEAQPIWIVSNGNPEIGRLLEAHEPDCRVSDAPVSEASRILGSLGPAGGRVLIIDLEGRTLRVLEPGEEELEREIDDRLAESAYALATVAAELVDIDLPPQAVAPPREEPEGASSDPETGPPDSQTRGAPDGSSETSSSGTSSSGTSSSGTSSSGQETGDPDPSNPSSDSPWRPSLAVDLGVEFAWGPGRDLLMVRPSLSLQGAWGQLTGTLRATPFGSGTGEDANLSDLTLAYERHSFSALVGVQFGGDLRVDVGVGGTLAVVQATLEGNGGNSLNDDDRLAGIFIGEVGLRGRLIGGLWLSGRVTAGWDPQARRYRAFGRPIFEESKAILATSVGAGWRFE
ncbi:MAG: hypothetical protein AAGF12_30200 [Myxococcota bacterium]